MAYAFGIAIAIVTIGVCSSESVMKISFSLNVCFLREYTMIAQRVDTNVVTTTGFRNIKR